MESAYVFAGALNHAHAKSVEHLIGQYDRPRRLAASEAISVRLSRSQEHLVTSHALNPPIQCFLVLSQILRICRGNAPNDLDGVR